MKEFLDGIFNRLRTEFNPELLGNAVAAFLSNFVVAIFIFATFYVVWRILNRGLGIALRRYKVDETSAIFFVTATKYTILTVGTVQAVASAGINMAAVAASLGLAGLTIGFAARDALSNIISGLLIFWDRPFVIGDLVEVEDNYGTVDRITLRSTRVVTVDGKMLAVPNSTIINTTVASYTNFPHLRLDISVTVAVTEDLDRTRELLLSVVRNNPAFMQAPLPSVVVTALNDYNVDLQLRVWLDNERDHIKQRFALREKMYKTLTSAGVDMPFETLQINYQPVGIEQ